MTISQYRPVWILLFLPTFASLAALVNVTVDDNAGPGDPISGFEILYSSNWSYGPDCPVCLARSDVEQVYMGGWHDATYDPSGDPPTPQNATFTFTGKHNDVLDSII